MNNMSTQIRYYLYRFKLFVNNILIPNCPDQRIQITWRSPHYTCTYNQIPYLFKESEAKIQTQIYLEDVLVKENLQASFLSLESEITIEKYAENGVQCLATLKIDLHDLAMSDHFHEIKTLNMFSSLSTDAWIGIGLSGIQYIEISENEALELGLHGTPSIYPSHQNHPLQLGEESRILMNKKRSNKQKINNLLHYQSMMKLIDGKDNVISELEEKALYLIQIVKESKAKQNVLQKELLEKNLGSEIRSEQKTNRSRSVSIPKPSSRRELSARNMSILVRESMLIQKKEMALLIPDEKSRLHVEQEINQLENGYQQLIDELEVERQGLKQKIRLLELGSEELKEAKSEIYESKKRNILIGEQNESLRKTIEDLQFQLSFKQQQYGEPLGRVGTEKTENRLITCASLDEEQGKMEHQIYKVKEKALLDEIERLRGKVRESDLETFQLKRQQSQDNRSPKNIPNGASVEELIRARMVELSVKWGETDQQNRQTIFGLQSELNQLSQEKRSFQRDIDALGKKNEYLKEQFQNLREANRVSEKKLLTLQRLQNKNKELEQFNKKLQQTIQKQQFELREKHKQLLEFTYSRNLPSAKAKEDKGDGLQQGSLQLKKRVSSIPLGPKRSQLRQSILEMGMIIKENKQKLDDAMSKQLTNSIEVHERILKDSKTKMKTLIQELNEVEEEPSSGARNQLGTRWQAQQILQENTELKAYIKTLLKKVVALETIPPPNKLDLMLKEREILETQRRLLERIENTLVEIQDNQEVEKQSLITNMSHIKNLYSQQMGIVQEEVRRVMDYKHQLSEIESGLNKREEKLNIIQHMSTNKRLAVILPQNKWREADLIEFAEMKKREKELKIKISSLESKALSDKMEFDKEKQDTIKKCKEEQKRLLSEAKEGNERQINNWKNQINELERRVREKEIEFKDLSHNMQLSKTALENEQRMNNMRVSEHNLKTHDMSNNIEEISLQLKNQVTKNRYSIETIKELNSTINKLTSLSESKQSEYQHLEEQYREFKEESEELVVQLDTKYKEMEEGLIEQNDLLVYEIERLKLLVQDEVIKSVRFEDQYQTICTTVSQLQREIESYNLQLDQKEEIMEQMRSQYQLKEEEIHVMEEEYSKLLETLGEESQRYSSLKGEYTSLQLLHQKAEDFIRSLEGKREEDRRQFQEILDERDKEKRGMINEINDMLRVSADKEIEYRRNVSEFQLHIRKIQDEMEEVRNAEAKLEQENQLLVREREDLRLDNGALLDELERFGKRDKKKKKAGFANIQVPYANAQYVQGSKGDMDKQVSNAGSGVEGHKSSSIQFQHGRGGQTQQLFTPMSVYERSSPPNHDQSSQHQFLYPSQRSNRTFVNEGNMQIKVIDVNGEEIVNRAEYGRSISLSGKTKFYGKSEPLEEVNQQSIDKQSKQHSKDYEKEANNSSDDDSEERKAEISTLQKTIQSLSKELSQKKQIITELQMINKKNQSEMLETKKYLQNSLKRKSTFKKSHRDTDNSHTPLNSDVIEITEIKEVGEENISDSLKEIENIGEQLDVMEEKLREEKMRNQHYQQVMEQMKEEMLMQEADYEKLLKVIEEMEAEINAHKAEEVQLVGRIERLELDLGLKNNLITEFQEVIRGKEEEREHSEKVIMGFERELEEVVKYKDRLELGLEETTEELMSKEKQLGNVGRLREELARKIEELNDQLFQSKEESDAKSALLGEYESRVRGNEATIQHLENDLETMAEKYLSVEEFVKQQKEEIEAFGDKFKHTNEKHEETIKRLVAAERQKGLLELEAKELQSQLSLKERSLSQLHADIQSLQGEMVKQGSMFERERGEFLEGRRELEDEIRNREMNIQVLKNDVEIVLRENKRLKEEKDEAKVEEEVSEQQMKSLMKSFETEMALEKARTHALQEEIEGLKRVISEQKGEIQELNQLENMRGSLIEQVEKNNRHHIIKLQGELKSINEQIQKRMELNAEEQRFQYQQKLALKDRDYIQLKILHQKEKKIMEEERCEMFSKKCELQETRITMAEKEEDYKFKIQKYEGSIKQICGKLRNIETERPHIELFEEVAFQNEIFRNRITELEEIVSFKETVNNEYYVQELEQMKSRFLVERQEYMMELQNYSAQVAELEEKNYQLTAEIQTIRYDDYHDLKEENLELEKSVVRLETCEEELKKELQLLKVKREQEYKQYLSDLRALRAK